MTFRFKWDGLHMTVSTFADELSTIKSDRRKTSTEAKMPKRKSPMTVDVHSSAAYRTNTVLLYKIKRSVKAKHLSSRS